MTRPFHKKQGPFTLKEISDYLGVSFSGSGDTSINDIAALSLATTHDLSFLDNVKYVSQAATTKAAAVIISAENAQYLPEGVAAIISPMPYADYAKALQMFYPITVSGVVHKSAIVESSAQIGEGTSIGAHSYIGENVIIGENCQIASNVSIICSEIGSNTIIHAGTCIGQDGFGFAYDGKVVVKVPQIGMVKIGDHVEIGAGSTVDRGSLENTEIGDYTKIDNLVQIGHNVKVGMGCQIVAQTGIAGSTTLGKGVIVGGQAGIVGHISLADGTVIAARSGVTKNIDEAGAYAGFPAIPMNQWRKLQVAIARLVPKKTVKK
ncbi:MAG: UDP-3-O-[3-hydroxymyristoyl] glucosamine N-acyltransferase [Alphaproteobacteria bacterium]|jgi:UDP-3-O-[3-hydroxymyristoyl] glucosamine N-acyltransferase